MADLSIGKYEITTQKAYDALKSAGANSDSALKEFDKNNDMKISEDELTEVLLEDEEVDKSKETEEESEKTNEESDEEKDSESDDSKKTDAEKTINSQLQLYDEQLSTLRDQQRGAQSNMATAPDFEAFQGFYDTYSSAQDEIDKTRASIRTLLIEAENGGVSVSSSSVSSSSSGAGSGKVVDFAMQFNKKSGAEMREQMQKDGYAFHDTAWCGDFVAYALGMAYGKDNVPGDYLNSCSNVAYCPTIAEWGREKGVLTQDVSKVKPGDIVLYQFGTGSWQHVELVKSVNNGQVTTIGGNTGNDSGAYGSNGYVEDHENIDLSGGVYFVLLSALD